MVLRVLEGGGEGGESSQHVVGMLEKGQWVVCWQR